MSSDNTNDENKTLENDIESTDDKKKEETKEEKYIEVTLEQDKEKDEDEEDEDEEYDDDGYFYDFDPSKIDINKIIDDINSKIVGQEEAVNTLVTSIYYNQLLIDDLSNDYHYDLAELDGRKISILLEGSTGTGKTAIVKEIVSKLDLPMVICSANSFSETGYVGASITDILKKLYAISSRNLFKAERGIVFLDEVDKIADNSIDAGRDMKKGVQDELLGFIGGGIYDFSLNDSPYGSETVHFDTSKLTFILSGAWTNLRERKIQEAKKKKHPLGFVSNNDNPNEITYTITAQDYVDDGLSREFFGRVKVITCTNSYELEDLKNILLNSKISPLKNFEKTVQMFGYIGITYTKDFVDELCQMALEMKTGARALQTIMSGVQNKMLKKLINNEFDYYYPIELTADLLKEYNMSLVRKVRI